MRVALTGGIATGKSYVRARVEGRGVPTIDADRLVHRLLLAGSRLVEAVEARFGSGVLAPSGDVDRRALGRLVFADASARRDLEALVHPAVYAEITAWMRDQNRSGQRWALADIPLLYETDHAGDFDRVMVVTCGLGTQIRRLMDRDGLSEADAHARLDAQWPVSRKAALADYVIDTDGTFGDTDNQVDAVTQAIDEAARGRV